MHKVGIIGCGGISESHYRGFTDTGRAKIEVVWDIDPERAGEAAARWGAEVASSAEELVGSVEVVVVATPGFAHREYVEMAADMGRHVLCEKPVALNMEDAMAMRDAVLRSGIKFMVGFNLRYDPSLATLKEVQMEGRIGGTVSAWARQHAPTSSARWRRIQESGHWRASKELSGGRINEFCSHAIDWLLWVLGRPRTVYGKALYVTEGFGLDDADYALIDCERGVGLLEINRHAGVARELSYGILGHGGSVALKDGRVWLTPMDEETVEVPVRSDVPSKHEHFLRCIENDEEPLTGIEDAIDTLRVCLAFNRSAESGQVEAV